MKIAIASTTKDSSGDISEKGGRSPFYLIFDENLKLIESIKNPFAHGGGGAGFGVAKMLEDKKINTMTVSQIGKNMEVAFSEANIKLISKTGSISSYLKTL